MEDDSKVLDDLARPGLGGPALLVAIQAGVDLARVLALGNRSLVRLLQHLRQGRVHSRDDVGRIELLWGHARRDGRMVFCDINNATIIP